MNGFDLMLLILTGVLVLTGLVKGLVRLLVGLAALVAAFALAATFHRPLADQMRGTGISEGPLMLIAFVLVFFGVMLAGGALAFLMRKLIKAAMLSWADRIGGAALGLLLALLTAALVILPVVAYSPHGEQWLRRSVLAPYVVVVADLATPLVPEELSERYHRRIQDLRRFWRDRVVGDRDVV